MKDKCSDWVKNKNATINPKNKCDIKLFQCNAKIPLNHKETGKTSQRISKVKSFIDKQNWEEISYPSGVAD